MPSFPKVVRNSRRNHCPCSRWILREVTRHQSKVLASTVLCSPWCPPHPPAPDLAAPGMGPLRVHSGPQSMKKSQSLAFLRCRVHRCQQQPQCPLQWCLTAGRLIPRERQHLRIALCFKFQQKQSFKVLPQKEWKLREKTADQHYICLGNWKYFYEMSCIFTVFPHFTTCHS